MRLAAFGMLVTAVLLPASAIRAAQSPPADATITGRVVDGGTQAPIAGARVMLLPAPTGRPTGPMGTPDSSRDRRRWRLHVQRHRRRPVSIAGAEDRIRVAGSRPSHLFQVAAGQSIAAPTFAWSEARAISGRVLDARGEPMPESW